MNVSELARGDGIGPRGETAHETVTEGCWRADVLRGFEGDAGLGKGAVPPSEMGQIIRPSGVHLDL